MSSQFVSARVEPRLKAKVQVILDELGISQSQAISMFYKAIAREHGIPFSLTLPNKETQSAIEEARKGKGLKAHKNTEEMFKDLGI